MWTGLVAGALSDQKIAVTGATGFIGTHLVHALVAAGCEPVLLTRAARADGFVWASDRVRIAPMDLTSAESVMRVLELERPTALIHLAGTRGKSDPRGAWVACAELNVCGTVQLLDAATRTGIRRVVVVGSAEEYGGEPGPLTEDHALLPVSPYGISKAAATRFALAMHASNGCPVVIVRPFTVYGPRQPSDMFIAEAVGCAVKAVPFRMTQGEQRRDLVFVGDVVQALLVAALTPGLDGHVFNIGSGHTYALKDVAKLIWQLSGTTAPLLIGDRPGSPDEGGETWADISRAREVLRWAPQVDLQSGLCATIDWARRACRSRRGGTHE
jgi:UDP-glucose 4-epimerase